MRSEGRSNANPHRVLILSRSFPPSLTVSGKRMYGFAAALPEFGWDTIVVTEPIPDRGLRDGSTAGSVESVQLYSPPWWPKPHLEVSLSPLKRNSTLRRLARVPTGNDVFLLAYNLLRLRRFCRDRQVAVIMASAGPTAILPRAWLLGRLAKLPVVFDLRDPWTTNFLTGDYPRWVQVMEKAMEAFLLRRAARTLFTSKTTRDEYRSLYSDIQPERFVTLYTGFQESTPRSPSQKSGPLTLVHFGNCYGERSLEPVLRALSHLRDLVPPSVILNMGRIQKRDLDLAQELGVADQVKWQEPVGSEDGAAILGTADLLLLLGYGDRPGFIPGKTFDYLASGNRILVLSSCSELNELVCSTGRGIGIDPGDHRGIADLIRSLRTDAQSDPLPLPEALSVKTSARLLARMLDELHTSRLS